MKQAMSSNARKPASSRIIGLILALCICILMSGLIVQAQLMNVQVAFYKTALAYCYQNDCTELNDTELNQADSQNTNGEASAL